MSQDTSWEMRQGLPGEGRLGVMDAISMGWRLLKSDFWRLWLVVLVLCLIQVGLSGVGSIPYLGACVSLATAVFVQGPLAAGLFFAIRRRIDGAAAEVGNLFAGFQYRYWQSVVANLIVIGIVLGMILALGLVVGAIVGVGAAITDGFRGSEPPVFLIIALVVVGVPALVAMIAVGLHFLFVFLAVWDYPRSGWQAIKASVRTVWANFWSVVGLQFLFFIIWMAVVLPFGLLLAVGLGIESEVLRAILAVLVLVCAIGCIFLFPAIVVWQHATAIYLYRSWTGQPLVQPIAAGEVATGGGPVRRSLGEGGPIPPTDIQPPGQF